MARVPCAGSLCGMRHAVRVSAPQWSRHGQPPPNSGSYQKAEDAAAPRSAIAPAGEAFPLSRLCHAVLAPGVEERLVIRLSGVDLTYAGRSGRQEPGDAWAVSELRCKAYVGPARATREGPDGGLDKTRFTDVRLDFHDGVAEVELDVGTPDPQEPWALRLKLYRRPAHALFQQEKVAELLEAVPRPAGSAQLLPCQAGLPAGVCQLEVLRLVPSTALEGLQTSFGQVLLGAVTAGVDTADVRELCVGAAELGPGAVLGPAAVQALTTAAGMGKASVVAVMLDAGVPPSAEAARAAEQAGFLIIAYTILSRMQSWEQPASLLSRAMENRLPLLAESILLKDPGALKDLKPADGAAAKKAHAAGAWSVLAAMLARGDPMPAPPRKLLGYALRAGHAGLARACLARCEGFEDMEGALKTCLDNNRVEIVREALEAQWRTRANQWSLEEGPALLALECGPGDEPAECGVCFDPLHKDPGVMLGEHGLRVCQHYVCTECAEHVQDEAANRLRSWMARRDSRLPRPPGPACPLCRALFVSARRLPDATVDPRAFFRLASLPRAEDDSPEQLRLTEKVALGALCALLPVNPVAFAPRLKDHLWPAWVHDGKHQDEDALAEQDFLRPGGMLAWLSDHLLELKVEEQRGEAPGLSDRRAWFQFFDYRGRGRLEKPELLRGVAKAYDVAVLASPRTPSRRARKVGVQKLRDLVDAVWDDARWADGVPLSDFEGPGGLAERLQAVLPAAESQDPDRGAHALSVDEALAKARTEDFQHREEDEIRAKERGEARERANAQVATCLPRQSSGGSERPGPGQHAPQRVGAETLLQNLFQAAQVSQVGGGAQRAGDGVLGASNVRIQCPFCPAVNACHAAPGHRVICGRCRSVFAVPASLAA